MKIDKQITAMLLLAAVTAAGCSKNDEPLQTRSQQPQQVRTTPVSTTIDVAALNATPKAAGPASFADGESAYLAGNYREATRVFEEYTSRQPQNAWGYFMLGLSAWKNGDLTKAETAFEEALRIDPEHLKSHLNLVRVLLDQRRWDDAIGRLTQADGIAPNSAEVQRLLGRTYYAQGKIDDAVSAYQRAIELDDKDAWSMNNLGLLYLEQMRPGDALPLLARAAYLRKDVAMFHNNLGMALEHTGRFAAAASAYSGALAADPNYAKAQSNLARVKTVKVNFEEPFDLEAMAAVHVEEKQTEIDETLPDN